ncbi:MAG: N-6 DNA methylase [Saprospiraceae bacterium]|nr:N-6 DNA methylase [Saprospiraceae bacterium]
MSKLYSIDEAASYIGINKQTLRNWEKIGKIHCIREPQSNYRLFPEEEIVRLKTTSKPKRLGQASLAANNKEITIVNDSDVKRLISKAHRIIRDNDGRSSIIERFDELTKLMIVYLGFDKQIELNQNKIADFANYIKITYIEFLKKQHLNVPRGYESINLNDRCIFKVFEHLYGFTIDKNSTDIKGLIYEEMLKDIFEKGENQQFFTPNTVVDFMASLLSSLKSGSICDPAAGTGGFLVKLLKNKSKFTEYTALEIDERLAWIAGINLKLHGCIKFESVCLPEGGSLGVNGKKYFSKFDAIITNPPFGSDYSDSKGLKQFILGKNKSSRRRGVLFVEQCINMLKEDGVVALIIDDGVLNHSSNTDVRELILARTRVLAVISLPVTAFMPYASVEASIVILQKTDNIDEKTLTFFAKADYVGRKNNGDEDYIYDDDGNEVLNNDLPSVLEEWKCFYKKNIPPKKTNIYIANIYRNFGVDNLNSNRLDFAYHHPSRQLVSGVLKKHKSSLVHLSDVCEEINQPVVPDKELQDQMILYTGLANIESDSEHYTQSLVSANSIKSSVKLYQKGDVLFSKMRPNLKKCIHVVHEMPGYCSSECVVLRPISNKISGRLLAALLRSEFVYGQIIHLITGIGRPRISIKDLRSILLPLPKAERMEAYELIYDEKMREVKELKEEAVRLTKLSQELQVNSTNELINVLLK